MKKDKTPKTTAYWKENVSEKRTLLLMCRKVKVLLAATFATALVFVLAYLAYGLIIAGPKQYRSEVLYAIRYDIHEEDEILKDFINEYNAYTWGDMMRSDKVMLRVMELLPGEDRKAVEASLDTGIASDPEFLAAGFTTTDPARSEAIAQAFNVAMAEFAHTLRDRGLLSIEAWKTEQAVLVTKKSYVVNVGLLGLLLGFLGALFVLRLSAVLDDRIYTTEEIDAPVLALGYCCTDSKQAALWNAEAESLQTAFQKGREVLMLTPDQIMDGNMEIAGKGILLELPWGSYSKALLAHTAANLELRGAEAVGVVLTEADAAWLSAYYGSHSRKESD